jgi:phage/plasmid-associated DNA primase
MTLSTGCQSQGDMKLFAAYLSGLQVLSGDVVPVRCKYRHQFPLLNAANFVFASKKIPDLTIADPADYARILMIQFEHRFTLSEDEQ